MAIGSIELILLKAWFLILTIVELPNINVHLFQDSRIDGFFSTLKNEFENLNIWHLFVRM